LFQERIERGIRDDLKILFPDLIAPAGAYALAGMGAAFACNAVVILMLCKAFWSMK